MERFNPHDPIEGPDARAAEAMIVALIRANGSPLQAALLAQELPDLRTEFGARGLQEKQALFDRATNETAVRALMTRKAAAVDFDPDHFGPMQSLWARASAASVLGRLPQAHRVQFRPATAVQILGTVAEFVEEGQSVPVVRCEFSGLSLRPKAVGAMTVVTAENLQNVRFDGTTAISDELVRALGEKITAVFTSDDSETAAAPAGIVEGATAVAASGVTVAAIATDLRAMVKVLADAGLLAAPVWLLSPAADSYFKLLKVSDPDAGLAGFPVVSSVGIEGVTLLASDRVAISAGDRVVIGASRHGDIEMTDTPTAGAERVSMWQTNSLAVKALAYVNWVLIAPSTTSGSTAVVTLTGASYA